MGSDRIAADDRRWRVRAPGGHDDRPDPHRHILALNNEPAVLDLFRDLLTDAGYRVTTRQYADKDMNALAALEPDLIILDYMWPEEDAGWSLLQLLRLI